MRKQIKFRDLVIEAVRNRDEFTICRIVDRYRFKCGLNADETWERVHKLTGIERGEWEDLIKSEVV